MNFKEILEARKQKQKQKPGDYARGSDPMPKAKPGRKEHPLQGKLVGESILREGARIEHAEDLVFRELPPSKGANRALQSLIDLEGGKHTDVTVKWDGSPALIFGRDDNGNFVLTDKSGFGAKGYDGKAKSAKELQQMLMNRPGASNPDPKKAENYKQFVGNMTDIFDEYEKATPKDYRGFFKGDLLYYNTPQVKDGRYTFKPNIVEYAVDVNSDIGKQIGQSKTGIVIHREVSADGVEGPLNNGNIFQGNEVMVFPPITVLSAPNVDNDKIRKLKEIVSKDSAAMDKLLDINSLTQLKLKKLPELFYTYMNSKVDTGLDNLGNDFMQWLNSKPNISQAAKSRVAEYLGQHREGFAALWEVVTGIMKVKDDIINQFDQQEIAVKQNIPGYGDGGEGYVLAHPEGDIKLVPREFFTKANRAVER